MLNSNLLFVCRDLHPVVLTAPHNRLVDDFYDDYNLHDFFDFHDFHDFYNNYNLPQLRLLYSSTHRLDDLDLHLAASPLVASTAAALSELPIMAVHAAGPADIELEPKSPAVATSSASPSLPVPLPQPPDTPPRSQHALALRRHTFPFTSPLPPRIPLSIRPPSSAPTRQSFHRTTNSISSSSSSSNSIRRRTFISPPPPLRLLQSAEPTEQPAFSLRPLRLSRQVHDYDEITRLRADGLAALEERQQRRRQVEIAIAGAAGHAGHAGHHNRPDSPRIVAEGDIQMREMLLYPLVCAENALLEQREERRRQHRRSYSNHDHDHDHDHDQDDHNHLGDSDIAKAAAALASRKKETGLALQSVQLGGSSSSSSSTRRVTTSKPQPHQSHNQPQHQHQPQPRPQSLSQPMFSPIRQPPAAVITRPELPPTPPLSPQREAYGNDVFGRNRDQGNKHESFWRDSIQSVISWRSG